MITFPAVPRDALFMVPSLCQSLLESELQKVEGGGISSVPCLLGLGHPRRCYAGNARVQSLPGEPPCLSPRSLNGKGINGLIRLFAVTSLSTLLAIRTDMLF